MKCFNCALARPMIACSAKHIKVTVREIVTVAPEGKISALDSIEDANSGIEIDYININEELTDFHSVTKLYGIGED